MNAYVMRGMGTGDGNDNEITQIRDPPTFVHCAQKHIWLKKKNKHFLTREQYHFTTIVIITFLQMHQEKTKLVVVFLHALSRQTLFLIICLHYFVPSIALPMSSSSDVIDLERRAMAGGVSLLVCCGAAKGSQPNADLMFSHLA